VIAIDSSGDSGFAARYGFWRFRILDGAKQLQPQIPPLRCGMTNKRTGNGSLRFAAE
jgi:hypothetical protein